MESFEIGNHVLIELDDSRRMAGFLERITEDGFILKVTHRDMPTMHMISERLSASIRDDLDAVPRVLLVAALLSRKLYTSVGRKSVMVETLAELQEAELIEKNREAQPTTFHELSVPVLTYINGGAVLLMEDSDDVLEDMTVAQKVAEFNGSVDAGLEEILKVAETPSE